MADLLFNMNDATKRADFIIQLAKDDLDLDPDQAHSPCAPSVSQRSYFLSHLALYKPFPTNPTYWSANLLDIDTSFLHSMFTQRKPQSPLNGERFS